MTAAQQNQHGVNADFRFGGPALRGRGLGITLTPRNAVGKFEIASNRGVWHDVMRQSSVLHVTVISNWGAAAHWYGVGAMGKPSDKPSSYAPILMYSKICKYRKSLKSKGVDFI